MCVIVAKEVIGCHTLLLCGRSRCLCCYDVIIVEIDEVVVVVSTPSR